MPHAAPPSTPPAAAPPRAQDAPPPPGAGPRSPIVRLALRFTVGALVLVAAFLILHWFVERHSRSISDDAFIESHIVNVAPEAVSGRIVRFVADENDRVEQGQILAEIEPVTYQDQVEQVRSKLALAEVDLKRQEASLEKLRKQVPLQVDAAKETLSVAKNEVDKAKDSLVLTTEDVNKTIDEAKAAVTAAQADLTLARQEYDRYTALAAEDATPKRKSDEVTRAHDAAKAGLQAAEARLAKAEAARTKIDVARHDLESAKTAVAKAETALELAQTGYDEIREV